MGSVQKSFVFRRGYYADDIENMDFDILIEYQLTPMSPFIYSEVEDLIGSEDILDATIAKNEISDGYYVDIIFSEHALQVLNELCCNAKFPYLIMFIKGHPFFMVALNGPFESSALRWDFDERHEAEMLRLNLIDES